MSDTILQKINNIDSEDLYLVEKDLCFHEKVSIAFLLFADNKANAEFILQKLLIISPTPDAVSDILTSYTTVNPNWKPFLVEALAIIKANKVLRKLGFQLSEIRTYFLPHIAEMSLHINHIVKALYYMCEMLRPVEAGKLVLDILDSVSSLTSKNHLRYYNYEHLEIFILDWITKRVLDASESETTDISILVDYFKLNEMKKIKDMLIYSLRHLYVEENKECERKESQELENSESSDNLKSDRINGSETNLVQSSPSEVRSIGFYTIKRETAGYILIINQQKFERSTNPELQELLPRSLLKERRGTDIDKTALEKTFTSFGYKAIVKENQNHIEVLSSIREVVKRSIIYDSLIVCILTHGVEGSVYGSDSIPIKISDIEKILTGEALIRKPKMLVIQACQGEYLQRARPTDLETDSPDRDAADYSDMVRAMSTVPGFASLRHIRTGSWFIQTLCKKIDELGDRDHMLEILTEVNDAVSEKRGYGNECMTPISSQTLRKKFRLPSRLA